MSEKPSFLSELKRRNVYKVAVAYAVVAWLLIQVATQVFPFFEIPNWAVRLVVLLLILGFPIALVLSWAFEITPEGIKRESEVAPAQSIRHHTGRKIVGLTIAVAVVAAGMLAFQLLRSKPTAAPLSGTTAAGSTIPVSTIPEKSVAVLPFENLSDEKANAYFASGIQDEILTRLAKIGALKVISRSSTQQYQSRPGNLRQIGQQLGVANILEGSVQKVADAVHVNAQLIRAATDDHLWAESYDCKLSEGIFAVEAEVAQKVALALNAKLTGAEQQVLTRKPTNNPAAYDAYLKGTAQYFQFTEETNKAAVHSFEEAVRLDPEFAGAWAALSRTHSLIFFHYEVTAPQREAAEKALAEATRLQPNLAETQLSRAYFQYWVLRDYKGALEMMQRLRTSWPSNAEVLRVMSFIYARLGQWKECVDAIDQSVGLDPRDQFTRAQSVLVHLATRDFGRCVQIADSALQIWPNDGSLLSLKAFALQASGELDDAQAVLAGTVPAKDGELDSRFGALLYQALLRRDPESVLKPFDAYSRAAGQNDGGFLLSWGTLQEAAGKISEARASFARARDKLQAQLNGQPENKELIGPLIFAFAVLGQQQDALKALDRFDALSAGDARAIGTGNELRARVFVRFGDKEKAIASLERVLSAPCDGIFGPPISPALLRLDPCWDSLRSDPRFQKLCEEKPR